jgi:hypothetical protein
MLGLASLTKKRPMAVNERTMPPAFARCPIVITWVSCPTVSDFKRDAAIRVSAAPAGGINKGSTLDIL